MAVAPLTLAVVLVSLAAQAAARPDRRAATPVSRHEDAEQKANRLLAGFDPSDILKQFDPYTISSYYFDLKEQEITARGSVKNLVISGISRLKLGKLSWALADGKAAVEISLPSIDAVGQYSVDGKLSASGIELPLQGKGAITAGFANLGAGLSIAMSISNRGQIVLEDFQWHWNMTDIQLHLDGLYGGLALGKMINKILGDVVPHLVLKAYHDQITETVTNLVMTKGKAYLLDLHKDNTAPQPYGWDDASDALDKDDTLVDDLSIQVDGEAGDQPGAALVLPLPLHVGDDDLAQDVDNNDGLEDFPAVSTLRRQREGDGVEVFLPVDGEVPFPLGADVDGEAVRVELRGPPRLLPPGALASEALSPSTASRDPGGLLLSMLRADSEAVTVELSGRPRFFPAGSLTADFEDGGDGDDDILLGNGVGLQAVPAALLRADTEAVTVELSGLPRFFPTGALSAGVYDGDAEDEGVRAAVLGSGARRLLAATPADPAVDGLPESREDLVQDSVEDEDYEDASPEDEW